MSVLSPELVTNPPDLESVAFVVQVEVEGGVVSDEAAAWLTEQGLRPAPEPEAIGPEPVAEPGHLQEAAEVYAHSLSTLKLVGKLAVEAAQSAEHERAMSGYWRDYTTHIAEMLNTDPEYRDSLDIEPSYTLPVIDGRARSPLNENETIVDMMARAQQAALEAAEDDERMLTQAARDGCDHVFASRADELAEGQTIVGVSMFPKQAMERDGMKYWLKKNYRPGLVFFQYQTRQADGNLAAGCFSVDAFDEAALRDVLSEVGICVPGDATSDEWLLHAEVFELDESGARDTLGQLRRRYYERVGDVKPRMSVTEYMTANQKIIEQMFETLYLPLAESLHTGWQHPNISQFINDTLDAAQELSSEARGRLSSVRKGEPINDAAARTLESLIRYAVVEQLRTGLKQVLHSGQSVASPAFEYHVPALNVALDVRQISVMAASNIRAGVAAGRSYGGCGQDVQLAREIAAGEDTDARAADSESGDAGDGLGPLQFSCPKGHQNTREFGRLREKCRECGTDVSCGKSSQRKEAKRSTSATILQLFAGGNTKQANQTAVPNTVPRSMAA